jgi:hypothetical protein
MKKALKDIARGFLVMMLFLFGCLLVYSPMALAGWIWGPLGAAICGSIMVFVLLCWVMGQLGK